MPPAARPLSDCVSRLDFFFQRETFLWTAPPHLIDGEAAAIERKWNYGSFAA
jgi:hypothetical protein